MPRESSDARAALMTVYMSQRSYLLNSSNPPTAAKLKAAERPAHRKLHQNDLATMKKLKSTPHPNRRRSDAGLGGGLGLSLARTGRTIYGVGEASREIRRQWRSGGLPNGVSSSRQRGTSEERWAREQVTLIERGKEMARRDEEVRRHVREKEKEQLKVSWKKAEHTWVQLDKIGDNLKMVVGGMGWGAEEVAHADRYFDMYINAEACGGN